MTENRFGTSSFKNKVSLQNSKIVGCYHCLEVFNTSVVVGYTDKNQTALCPKCGIDSVVGSNDKPVIFTAKLIVLNDEMFTDPGYKINRSAIIDALNEALKTNET